MLLRHSSLVILVGLLLITSVSHVWAGEVWHMIHGNVVQVFPEQRKILFESMGEKKVLVLAEDCQILRLGRTADVASLRPITPNAFQDALCWINPQGQISCILANYRVQEEDGVLVSYDIFGNLK